MAVCKSFAISYQLLAGPLATTNQPLTTNNRSPADLAPSFTTVQEAEGLFLGFKGDFKGAAWGLQLYYILLRIMVYGYEIQRFVLDVDWCAESGVL